MLIFIVNMFGSMKKYHLLAFIEQRQTGDIGYLIIRRLIYLICLNAFPSISVISPAIILSSER